MLPIMATATAEKKAIKKPAKKVPLADTPKEVAEAKPTKSLRDSDRFAIIETGGKQYRVSEGDLIKIEKIKGEVNKNDRDLYKVGDTVVFEKVLLKSQGVESDNLNIGAPFITGATVTASIIKIARHPKITVIKYKQKSRYFKKNGHKQPYFEVKIEKIG